MNQLPLPIAVLLFFLLAIHLAPTPQSSPTPQLPLSKGLNLQLQIPIPASPASANSPAIPPATLAVWLTEPSAGTPLRGTVILLHGFMTNHSSVANAADALRYAGYRAVNVDLRGFGRSTGSHSDFGITDAHDIQALIDYLQARDLCGPTVGIYGTSMGAATAILLAGQEPRVASVVAVAPFADIRSEVPSFSRSVLGNLASLLPDEHLNQVADVVGALAHWNLDSARPIDAITQTQAPVLLIHGDADDIIPHAASEKLHAAAPTHSQLITPHNRGHLDLCFDIPGELQPLTREWFDQTLMPH